MTLAAEKLHGWPTRAARSTRGSWSWSPTARSSLRSCARTACGNTDWTLRGSRPTRRTSRRVPLRFKPGTGTRPANGRAGLKGGPARAAKLTTMQRREQARKAARARWANKRAQGSPNLALASDGARNGLRAALPLSRRCCFSGRHPRGYRRQQDRRVDRFGKLVGGSGCDGALPLTNGRACRLARTR